MEIALIRAGLEGVQEDRKAVRKELKDLPDAWNTATGMVPGSSNGCRRSRRLWRFFYAAIKGLSGL